MTNTSRAGGRLPRWLSGGVVVMVVLGAAGVIGAPARARSVRSPRGPELPESAPAVEYSTYLGGVAADQAWNIAVDQQGNSYIVGYTASSDFPTFHALQPAAGGSGDAFVAKFDPSGALVYSTYLGGSNMEIGWGIAVDDQGAAYVVGMTGSVDFPVVHAFQSSYHGGWDAFVAKIAPDGQSLVYSTFLGGSDEEYAYAIAVDATGAAYVTGETHSTNFPLLGAIQTQLGGSEDAFVAKLTPGGDALAYSTYLGGALGGETGLGIAVDPAGRAHVTGWTTAGDFPTANAFQNSLHGFWDVFVTELDASGGAFVYSTFLGGGDLDYVDEGEAVATDAAGDTYVTGFTGSPDFPVFDAYQFSYGGQIDAFVTELDPGGQMLYSSFLGGSNSDVGYGIALDPGQRIHVAGLTISDDFPVVDPVQPALNGFEDAFVARLSPGGSALEMSTYYGGGVSGREEWGATGLGLGPRGDVDLVGQTSTLDFPVVHAYQSFNRGSYDAFVVRLSGALFGDGFESGDATAWSAVTP